ncbi:MAG: hypothetical protein AMXMBFR4_31250 [Candidatus Hydrogenedentota bacterium]
MDCKAVRERLIDYLLDDVRFSERVAIGVHTARCYGCNEELADFRTLLELTERIIQHPQPRSAEDRLWALIRRRDAERFEHTLLRRWRLRLWAVRAAAAAIVLLALGLTAPFIRHSGLVQQGTEPTSIDEKGRGKLGAYSLSEALSRRSEVIREEYLLALAKDPQGNRSSNGGDVNRL